jgi:hypothetical protein
VAWEDFSVGCLLQIKDVKGVGRICNDVGNFLGGLGVGVLSEEGADSAKRGYVWACG